MTLWRVTIILGVVLSLLLAACPSKEPKPQEFSLQFVTERLHIFKNPRGPEETSVKDYATHIIDVDKPIVKPVPSWSPKTKRIERLHIEIDYFYESESYGSPAILEFVIKDDASGKRLWGVEQDFPIKAQDLRKSLSGDYKIEIGLSISDVKGIQVEVKPVSSGNWGFYIDRLKITLTVSIN